LNADHDQTGSRFQAVAADVRAAWWSPWAAARARGALGALPTADREALTPLLEQADAERRQRMKGPLAWLLYLAGACVIAPILILLGAPHLLDRETGEEVQKLEEVAARQVYLPPPPPPDEEEEPPVLDPDEVTGPVHRTSPGASDGVDSPFAVEAAPVAGVIAARVDPTVAQSSWLQAFSDGGGGSGSGEGGGQGIPDGMVYVPGGAFQMGTVAGVGESHEHPRHAVELSPYAIDRDEVSVSAFNRWCDDHMDQCGWNLGESASMMAGHPVTGVTWYEARAFCRSLGRELPTEAQWEMAARWDPEGGNVGRYPWGNDDPTCDRANFLSCHVARTVPLGTTRGRSPVGARDMAGNAREWVADRFGPYGAGKQVDPRGPGSGGQRVLRGGSFGGAAEDIRNTDRDSAPPDLRMRYNGFRCVVAVVGELPPPQTDDDEDAESDE